MAINRQWIKLRNLTKKLEQRVLRLVNIRMRNTRLDRPMRFVSSLGSAWASVGLCLLLWYVPEYRAHAAPVTFSVVGSHALVQALKRFIRRTRPYSVVPMLRRVTAQLMDPSFPSGHTTAAFGIAGVFGAASGLTAFIVWPLASLIGISRIYLGHHYPSDVIAGAAIGFSFASWASHMFA